MPQALTRRQRLFVAAYAGNATEAARIAGYSSKSPNEQAKQLMKNPKIIEALKERVDNSDFDAAIATRKERQAFWTSVMRDEGAEMKDRLKASELLGKSEGDFLERVEQVGAVPLDIKVEFVESATPEGV